MICDSWYQIFDLIISLITGGLVVYFACKSYYLEKNNGFHGKGFLNKMNNIANGKEYIVVGFLNEGNVEGYITEFLIELSYISLKNKFQVFLGKKEKYLIMLFYDDLFFDGIVNQENLPWCIEPRKSKIMCFNENLFIDDLKNLKSTYRANIKNFVFKDSTCNLYKYRISKKEFPELFM